MNVNDCGPIQKIISKVIVPNNIFRFVSHLAILTHHLHTKKASTGIEGLCSQMPFEPAFHFTGSIINELFNKSLSCTNFTCVRISCFQLFEYCTFNIFGPSTKMLIGTNEPGAIAGCTNGVRMYHVLLIPGMTIFGSLSDF